MRGAGTAAGWARAVCAVADGTVPRVAASASAQLGVAVADAVVFGWCPAAARVQHRVHSLT